MRFLLLAALVCAAPLAAAVQRHGQDTLTAAVAVPLLVVAARVCGRWPLAGVAVPVAMGLAASTELLAPEYWPALAVFGYLAGQRVAARPALWFLSAVALAGLPLCVFVQRELWAWPTQLLTLLLATGLPWMLGRHRKQYTELVGTGWRLAEQLEQQQRTAADRARLRERARIAGDMHDSLGHDLTLLAVRAGALQVDPDLDADQRAAAGELREAAAAATARLRDIIGVLREDGEEAPTVLRAGTVREVVQGARASGLTVTLAGGEAADGLPPMARHAAHRVVQEALTNAAKHAPGAEVRVTLAYADARCTVTVANDPPPDAAPDTGRGLASGGAGLVGLDERVRLAGGTLRSGPTGEGGFEVTAELPVAEPPVGASAAPEPPGEAFPVSAVNAVHAVHEATPGLGPGPGPGSSTSARELALARQRLRRSLAQTVLAPLAVVVGILLLSLPVSLVSSSLSVLDEDAYAGLRPGTPRAEVEDRMPMFTRDGPPDAAPRTPEGQRCVYYSTALNSGDAYRLCFARGALAAKSRVGRTG
ncbi:histidine kinase [Streptomyces sp. NBC_01186]|uniref:sensor histidine kinase n=1 Tax=Streptomyces sp. NBC_01186 TaxID=2903765 RepID=UPI002E14CD8A|nr:histidine kinase [Streptomyces sp. NBC_01186]